MKRTIAVLLAVILLMSCVSAFASPVRVMTITGDRVRLRSGSSTSSSSLRTLNGGEHVFYLGSNGSFCKVHTSRGETGYVFRSYLKYHVTVDSSRIFGASSGARLYKKASTSSACVTTLPAKSYVLVGAIRDGWAYVKTITGQVGFMKTSYLHSLS